MPATSDRLSSKSGGTCHKEESSTIMAGNPCWSEEVLAHICELQSTLLPKHTQSSFRQFTGGKLKRDQPARLITSATFSFNSTAKAFASWPELLGPRSKAMWARPFPGVSFLRNNQREEPLVFGGALPPFANTSPGKIRRAVEPKNQAIVNHKLNQTRVLQRKTPTTRTCSLVGICSTCYLANMSPKLLPIFRRRLRHLEHVQLSKGGQRPTSCS